MRIKMKCEPFRDGYYEASVMVDGDGTVRVYDSIAHHYTRCHSLSATQQQRARRIAAAVAQKDAQKV